MKVVQFNATSYRTTSTSLSVKVYDLPRVTLSDVASLLSQNPTQLSTTIRVQGTYTCKEHIYGGNICICTVDYVCTCKEHIHYTEHSPAGNILLHGIY